MIYKAPYDGFVRAVTVGITAILLIVIFALLRAGLGAAGTTQRAMLGVGVLGCLAILIGAWAYAPTGYALDGGSLIIRRPAGDVSVALDEIREVRVDSSWLGASMKPFPGGNSGLFGLYGSFRNSKLGDFKMYGRRARGAVVMRLPDDEVIVITPEEPEKVVREIEKRRSGTAGDD